VSTPLSLKEKVKLLSNQPGVYQFFDAQQRVIYVGKARHLKKRVGSYFRSLLSSRKTEALMVQVVDVQVTITESENEALLLESNLIKRFKPRYNVLLRDDKSYPYLYLSTNQDFPRLDFYRGAKGLPGRYFGPFPSAGAVRENLALIQKLFKLRQCNDYFFQSRNRPCLQYQIDRCTAPCVDYVTKEAYQEQVRLTILFLEGKNTEIVKELTQKMELASDQLRFEEAARYRNQISLLRQLQSQHAITGESGNIDVIGIAEKMGYFAISILFIRSGRLIGHRAFFPNVPHAADRQEVLNEFIPQYYLSPLRGDMRIDRIVLTEKLPEKDWIQSALQEKLGYAIVIHERKQKAYQQWQALVKRNAEFAIAQHAAEKNNFGVKLETLQKSLGLPNPVQRIECFDVSHTMGQETVASCVVFNEQGPAKEEYRRFNISGITPGDDYAALSQATLRRYKRLKSEAKDLPDLILIDGGLGQLHQVEKILEELQVSGVVLAAISKGPARKVGLEKIFILGRKEPLRLDPADPAFHLVQFIRDEAHRFAITAHRARRVKKGLESQLEKIEGIGPKRRRDLLNFFGGLQELKKASVADIAKIPGINEELAKRIYDSLHE
jgi:excinuclease ABC subunit C